MKNVTALLGLLLISTSAFAAKLDCSVTVSKADAFAVVATKSTQISTDFVGINKSEKIEIQKNLYMEVQLNKVCAPDGGPCFGTELSMSLQAGSINSQTIGSTSNDPIFLRLSDENSVVTGSCRPAL